MGDHESEITTASIQEDVMGQVQFMLQEEAVRLRDLMLTAKTNTKRSYYKKKFAKIVHQLFLMSTTKSHSSRDTSA